MDETDKKIRELTEAMHAERDIRIRNRMMAVRGILAGYPTKDAAYFADVDRRTVQLWMARFDEGGIGGLRDAPGRGRPPRAGYGRIRKLADRLAGKNMLTPRKLRNWIRGKLNARYSLCSMRRILRLLGFSSKRSATMYASAADSDAVRQWQAGAAGTISWAKRRGFAVVVQDESIFIRIGTNGRKLWSRVGEPVAVIRHGRRDRTVVYGALAEDGTRLMRQYERFDGPTFVRYLKEARRKWGKVLLIMGQRGPAQDQGSQEVLGGARRSGDPVPAHRHAEAQRSRVRMEGCKVPARHFRTLRNAGGPDACGVRVFQDLFDQA